MLISDDLEIIHDAKLAFQKCHYGLLAVPAAVKALEKLGTENCNGLVLSSEMEDMDGLTLLGKVRTNPYLEKMPVIVIQTRPDCEQRVGFLRAGASDVIERPFHPDELVIRMDRLINNMHIQDGIEGFLNVYPFADLVQNFLSAKKTGTLEVYSEGSMGFLVLVLGQIIKAGFNDLHQDEAFYAMNELKTGAFRFTPSAQMPGENLGSPLRFNYLLMNAAYVEDERERLGLGQVLEDKLLKATGKKAAFADLEAADLLTVVLDQFQQNAHQSKKHLIETNIISKGRMEFALAWLLQNEYLRYV